MAEVDGRAADRNATQLMSVASTDREPNRWAVLALLSVAQLMVVLDATIVTIAIPSAQEALHFSTQSRQWIVTAYALAFGSLLLLGGKLGDLFGRKWALIAGLIGFSIASAIGGLAQSFGVLVAARTLQGAFAALLAPSALGLLTVTFEGSPDRPTAFGIFGAIAGGGASLGLILGGARTQVLSWRWCLYVNLVIAVPATVVALRLLVNHRAPERDPIDIPGVLTSALGLFALVSWVVALFVTPRGLPGAYWPGVLEPSAPHVDCHSEQSRPWPHVPLRQTIDTVPSHMRSPVTHSTQPRPGSHASGHVISSRRLWPSAAHS